MMMIMFLPTHASSSSSSSSSSLRPFQCEELIKLLQLTKLLLSLSLSRPPHKAFGISGERRGEGEARHSKNLVVGCRRAAASVKDAATRKKNSERQYLKGNELSAAR